MEDSFDLLEEKVRKAADLVKRLRKENRGLEDDLGKARAKLHETEKRAEGLEKSGDHGKEGLQRELASLKRERQEVRGRIAKLVEVLEGLD
jgi:chromosome segregation ATPase